MIRHKIKYKNKNMLGHIGNVNLYIRQAEFDTQIPEFDIQISEFDTQIPEFDTWIRQES